MARSSYVLLDDAVFPREPRLIDVMLAEVKTGKPCTMNSTLLSLATRNMEYALDAIGAFPEAEQGSVADALRSSGAHQDARMRIRLFAFGAKPNKTLGRRLPAAVQLTWPDVLTFIHRRFTSRSSVANYHDQWDDYGRTLWVNAQRTRDAFLETTIAALSGDSDNVSATAATHGRDPRN